MKLLAILSAKKLITLSAVGVLSLATVGGVILNNSNEEPPIAQSALTFDGEVKESPTAEIVEEEKMEEKVEEINTEVLNEHVTTKTENTTVTEYITNDTVWSENFVNMTREAMRGAKNIPESWIARVLAYISVRANHDKYSIDNAPILISESIDMMDKIIEKHGLLTPETIRMLQYGLTV